MMKETRRLVKVCDICGNEGHIASCLFCGKDVCENCNVFNSEEVRKHVVVKLGLDEFLLVAGKDCIEKKSIERLLDKIKKCAEMPHTIKEQEIEIGKGDGEIPIVYRV